MFLYFYLALSHLARQPQERTSFAGGGHRAILSPHYFCMILYKLGIFLTAFILSDSMRHSVQPTEGSQLVQLLQEGCDEGCHNCDIFQFKFASLINDLIACF